MIAVKVSLGRAENSSLYARQTPGGTGRWGDHQFFINTPVEKCDWWVVCHGSSLQTEEKVVCDPDHIVYVSMEPSEDVLSISSGFLDQFRQVVLCDPSIRHGNVLRRTGLTWWVGLQMSYAGGRHHLDPKPRFGYDELKVQPLPQKLDKASLIVSDKTFLPGHKARLRFVEELRRSRIAHFVDVYGGGFNPVPDKWEAIAPYKYHLVLENCIENDYWTEKLADAYLGFSYPLYSGAPNIGDYFPPAALTPIDISRPEQALLAIERAVRDDYYQQHLDQVLASRSLVLDRYNIFNLMSEICETPARQLQTVSLRPNGSFWEHHAKRAKKHLHRFAAKLTDRMAA